MVNQDEENKDFIAPVKSTRNAVLLKAAVSLVLLSGIKVLTFLVVVPVPATY